MSSDGIGKAPRRREDFRFLKGIGRYTDDINQHGQTYCYIVRSSVAHGTIDKLDVSAAEAAPGVVKVLTGDDFTEVGGLPSR